MIKEGDREAQSEKLRDSGVRGRERGGRGRGNRRKVSQGGKEGHQIMRSQAGE